MRNLNGIDVQNVYASFRKPPMSTRVLRKCFVPEKPARLVMWLMPRMMYAVLGGLMSLIVLMTSIEHVKLSDERLFLVVNQYKEMIARDDRIINFFTHGDWDRDDCIRQEPEQLLADGTWLISVQVVPCEEEL